MSPTTIAGSHRTLPTVGLLSVTVVWGSTFFLIKDAVERMPVADFLAVRFLVAAVVMACLYPRAVSALSAAGRRHAVVLGLLYGAAQLLQTYGLERTPASVSGFVTGMYVVFTPLLAAALLRERVGALSWAAVALATGGLALLSLRGLSVEAGVWLTLASALLYALHILALGAWSTRESAYGLAVVQMVVIAVVCGAAALPGGVTTPPDPTTWAAVLYTALVAGAFALVVQAWAQAQLDATRAAVVMTMEPVFASAFAVALGGESMTVRMLAGGALVLTAMYVVELGPRHAAEATVPHPTAP
ncbi:MAG: DMT family transporter [Actinomycetota bacterium]|nr:DMT family transporter [Actinomycetota bacterium]